MKIVVSIITVALLGLASCSQHSSCPAYSDIQKNSIEHNNNAPASGTTIVTEKA